MKKKIYQFIFFKLMGWKVLGNFDTSIKKANRYNFGTGIITGLVPASGIAEKNGWKFFIYLCDEEITDFNKTQFEYSNRYEEYL
jgi:hypothetical protein